MPIYKVTLQFFSDIKNVEKYSLKYTFFSENYHSLAINNDQNSTVNFLVEEYVNQRNFHFTKSKLLQRKAYCIFTLVPLKCLIWSVEINSETQISFWVVKDTDSLVSACLEFPSVSITLLQLMKSYSSRISPSKSTSAFARRYYWNNFNQYLQKKKKKRNLLRVRV